MISIALVMCMLLGGTMVFVAYREGIKTGLSLKQDKLPPITKKEKEKATDELTQMINKDNEIKLENEKLMNDVTEAMNLSNLYE